MIIVDRYDWGENGSTQGRGRCLQAGIGIQVAKRKCARDCPPSSHKVSVSAPVGAQPLFDDLRPSRFHRRPTQCLRPLPTVSILSSNLVIYVWMKICLPPLDSLDGCSDHLSLVRLHLRWIPNYHESRTLEVYNTTPPSKTPCHLHLPFLEFFDSSAYYSLHSSTLFLLLCETLLLRVQVHSSHALSALAFFNGI